MLKLLLLFGLCYLFYRLVVSRPAIDEGPESQISSRKDRSEGHGGEEDFTDYEEIND